MKLTVLGGGGVRSPLLAGTIVSRAEQLNLNEIVFMDNDIKKLTIYGGLAREIALRTNEKIKFILTSDPAEALKDADFIITTLRVGQDRGRILDEKIALEYDILGQETTGAGGFAMAMRSIPALKFYCDMAKRYAKPAVQIFNFTNPSGLVTQALRDEGFENVYGICDGPSEFMKELEALTGARHGQLSAECFGLNHLSWFRSIKLNGEEIVHKLIDSQELYKKTEMRLFDPDLVRSQGMLLNGYLYYFYHREKAVQNIKKSGKTRGETIFEINTRMNAELSALRVREDFEKALEVYLKYYSERENSYMAIESGSAHDKTKKAPEGLLSKCEFNGGYAGVALDFIESCQNGKEKEMVLLVPNSGSIDGLRDDDIVEITCRAGLDGVKPVRIGEVPEIQMNLIRQVKLFERLAVKSIRLKSIELAREALMVHPLVNSYTLAKNLTDRYIEAHREYIGEWK